MAFPFLNPERQNNKCLSNFEGTFQLSEVVHKNSVLTPLNPLPGSANSKVFPAF